MAIGILENFDDLKSKLSEIEPDRYELWYTNLEIVLVPTVTSKNVHTYVYRYSKQDDLKAVKELFKGRQLKMSEILYDKW